MHDFINFVFERLETKINEIDEASSHEEIETLTNEARLYLDKLKNLVGKGAA